MTRESHGVTGYPGLPGFTHPGETGTPEFARVRLLGYTPVSKWCTPVGKQRPLMLGQVAGFPFVHHDGWLYCYDPNRGGDPVSLPGLPTDRDATET